MCWVRYAMRSPAGAPRRLGPVPPVTRRGLSVLRPRKHQDGGSSDAH